jgi:hypothetical protein
VRTLNPRDTRPQSAVLNILGLFERDPGIFRQVMLRRVPAPVEIQRQGGSTFLEGLSQKVDTANNQR